MHIKLLMMIAFTAPLMCHAATSTWEAFEYKNCRHWEITNDFLRNGESFNKAKKIEKEINASLTQPKWSVLYGFRMFEEAEGQYGVCSEQANNHNTRIECRAETKFPLAGTTFAEVKPQVFECVKGCKKIPFSILYAKGYEDGGDSIEWERAIRKFELTCHEERRAKKFFKPRKSNWQ